MLYIFRDMNLTIKMINEVFIIKCQIVAIFAAKRVQNQRIFSHISSKRNSSRYHPLQINLTQ